MKVPFAEMGKIGKRGSMKHTTKRVPPRIFFRPHS